MKKTTEIEIDHELYKYIVNHSNYINEPAADVLKRLLNIDTGPEYSYSGKNENQEGFRYKGVFLKSGLILRKQLREGLVEAVVKNGYIEYKNKRFSSPSAAAVSAAGGIAVNGWRFWEFFDEKQRIWLQLDVLRSNRV